MKTHLYFCSYGGKLSVIQTDFLDQATDNKITVQIWDSLSKNMDVVELRDFMNIEYNIPVNIDQSNIGVVFEIQSSSMGGSLLEELITIFSAFLLDNYVIKDVINVIRAFKTGVEISYDKRKYIYDNNLNELQLKR